MRISSGRTLNRALACAALVVASASSARATLTITNGNFETYDPAQAAGGNYPGVYQWFNAQNATAPWYFNVGQATAVSPTGSASLVLTGNHDPVDGVPLPWIYQSIGFNTDGKTTLKLQFDLGGFTDNNPISAHIDAMLFKANGFAGADNTDILGAVGATQVGSTFSIERLHFAGNSGVINVPIDFNLSGVAATDELYLRFQSTVPADAGTDSNYVRLDNIKIRPDVVHVPVDLSYVGLAAGGTWDDSVTASFKNSANAATAFQEGDRVTFDNSGAVDVTGVSTVTVVGSVSPGSITVNSSHDYTFNGSGSIAGLSSASATFTKSGTGKVTFAGRSPNGFSGGTQINAGSVILGSNYDDSYDGSGDYLGSGPIVNNGTLVLARTYTPADGTYPYPKEFVPLFLRNKLSGPGNLIINGNAFVGNADDSLTTGAVNDYTGATVINGITATSPVGAFVFWGDVNAFGSPSVGTTVMAGSTLATVDEFHLGPNAVLAEPLTLNGTGYYSGLSDDGTAAADNQTLHRAGALFIFAGVRTFTGPITLASTTAINVHGGADATLSGTFTAAAGAGLEKIGVGTLHFKGTTMQSLTVTSGTLIQSSGTTKVKTLSVAAFQGIYDLTTSTAVVDYDGTATPYASLLSSIQNGDLISSADASKYVLAIVENSTLGSAATSINGVPIDATSVIVRGTFKGDFDANGSVNFTDLLLLAKNYGGTGKIYQQGDSDYSGTVDFSDLLALAKNYGQVVTASEASANGLSSAFLADFAAAQTLAPEPASLALFGMSGLLLANRRRAR